MGELELQGRSNEASVSGELQNEHCPSELSVSGWNGWTSTSLSPSCLDSSGWCDNRWDISLQLRQCPEATCWQHPTLTHMLEQQVLLPGEPGRYTCLSSIVTYQLRGGGAEKRGKEGQKVRYVCPWVLENSNTLLVLWNYLAKSRSDWVSVPTTVMKCMDWNMSYSYCKSRSFWSTSLLLQPSLSLPPPLTPTTVMTTSLCLARKDFKTHKVMWIACPSTESITKHLLAFSLQNHILSYSLLNALGHLSSKPWGEILGPANSEESLMNAFVPIIQKKGGINLST